MKRTLLFVLLLLSMLASTDAVEINGIHYNIDIKGKTAEVISSPDYYKGDIVIPKSITYKGVVYSVTSIGDRAFYYCSGLKSVDIPSSITIIGEHAFYRCTSLTSVNIPESLTSIGDGVFMGCCRLKSVTIPDNVTSIGDRAFEGCNGLTTVTIPDNVTSIGGFAFQSCFWLYSVTIGSGIKSIDQCAFGLCQNLTDVYCYAKIIPTTVRSAFQSSNIENVILHVPAASISAYQAVEPWKNFKEIAVLPTQCDYRPFVEDGKVWKVGANGSGNPLQLVEYYYFDGDTIIDGKTCKQMMRQQFVNPDFAEFYSIPQKNSPGYDGAWYEENKKVYAYDPLDKQFKLMYDFSLNANDTLNINNLSFVIGSKQTGGLKGFKGVYRNILICREREDNIQSTPWLEGVGSIYGPKINVYPSYANPTWFLISCTAGDEVIYFNDDYEDGATPEGLDARKRRFDFTHTIKTQPKARQRSNAEQSPYGEYNDLQLDINLDLLDDAYQVRITDESGKIVYEKAINAGNIVGLNIDISAYAKGRYTVTVENNTESFTGEFEAQTTGIVEVKMEKEVTKGQIYNLQGQRITSLQKGLNIVNGKKVFIK